MQRTSIRNNYKATFGWLFDALKIAGSTSDVFRCQVCYDVCMIVNVIVKPGVKSGTNVLEEDDGLIVRLHEKAHDGEANSGLVRALSDYYKVAKSQIVIKSGQKSRKKIVEIIGK